MTTNQPELLLAGLRLNPEFPFMNAPGSVNGSGEENFKHDFGDMVRASGAVVMVGSITSEYKEGNEAKYGGPVYRPVKSTGLTYNSMGLPNLGITRISQLLPDLIKSAADHNKKLAVSLAPMTSEPGIEWYQMAETALHAGAEIIEFNAGCPNIYDSEGNPKVVLSLVPDAMGEALEYVQSQLGNDFVAGVKISPTPVDGFDKEFAAEYHPALLRHQAEVINQIRMVGYVAAFNTFGGQIPLDEAGEQLPLSVPGGAGGVSGPAIAGIAHNQTITLLDYLSPNVDVVAAGGINTGQELYNRIHIDRRVKLGSAVTALWEAPSMGMGATRLAHEYAEIV